MMGLEFTGEIPFTDVNIHSVIQAPDGRRMSKSLGTGIDPLDEIDEHGADALRFGLLAMSSTQDVRYSDAKVAQGRDLANKLWNASRLVLLNAGDAEPGPSARRSRTAGSSRACSGRSPRSTGDVDGLRLLRRRRRALPLLLVRVLRLVSRDRQAAPLRRRARGRRQPGLGPRALPGPRASVDPVRHRGDLGLRSGPAPAGPLIVASYPGLDESRLDPRGGGRDRGRDRADARGPALARPRGRAGRQRAAGAASRAGSRAARAGRAACPSGARRGRGRGAGKRRHRWSCSAPTRSIRRRSPSGSRRARPSFAPRSSAASASSRTRASSPRRPPRSSRRSARSSRGTAPSSRKLDHAVRT